MDDNHDCNCLPPILRLPHDLVVDIFLMAVHKDEERSRDVVNTSPLTLSGVCKSWRSSAISFPYLWSRVFAQETSVGVYGLHQWIIRSKELPLTIDLTQVPNAILEVVAAHASRWKDVSLKQIAPERVKFFLGATVNAGYTPSLTRFSATVDSMCGFYHPKSYTVLKLFQSGMRFRLTCLEELVVTKRYRILLPCVEDVHEPIRPHLTFESRHFHSLRKISRPQMHEWEECHAALILFPNLEELDVYTNFRQSFFHPRCSVSHSKLKKLHFWLDECCIGDTLHVAISRLHLPSLEELSIAPYQYYFLHFRGSRIHRILDYMELIDTEPWGAIVAMLKQSVPPAPLHTLQVFIPPERDDLESALPYLPNITSFGILDNETFQMLVDTSVMPNLVDLALYGNGISPASVVKVFESRVETKFRTIRSFVDGQTCDWDNYGPLTEWRNSRFEVEQIGPML